MYYDLARFGELDGVAYQIDDHLPQPQRVAQQGVGDFRRDVIGEFETLFGGADGQRLQGITQSVPQIKRQRFQVEFARFDLGKIQNIVEQQQQRIGRRRHHREVIALLRRQVGVAQQFAHADDAVHRGADFVTHVGEKLAFGAVS